MDKNLPINNFRLDDGSKVINSSSISPSMTFSWEGQEVGKLWWDNGILRFEGKTEESARAFFDFLLQWKPGDPQVQPQKIEDDGKRNPTGE